MPKFNIYLKLPEYLDQWVRAECWSQDAQAVSFPKGSAERIVMALFLAKLPKGQRPDIAAPGLTPVEIHGSAGKPPASFNHLTEAGKTALVSTIKNRFKKMMWEELSVVMGENVKITDIIYAFMDAHGIDDTERNFEAIRQMYNRMRAAYCKKQ